MPEVPASLTGIRVVDLTSNVAGPFATQVLGDLGADVVKVERPGGDDARGWGPPFWPSSGQGVAFSSLNTNKRSIELDLRSETGTRVFRALLERADVLVQNMRPGTFEKLGYSWDMLHGLNPRLVYCELNGFGASGPKADQPAYDVFMQAFSGLMSFTGEAGRPPARIPVSVLDKGTGLWAVIGILNALRLRDQTGRGSHVQASLLETALKWEAGQILGFAAAGQDPQPWGSSTPGMAPYEAFETRRGYIIIAAGNERLWRKLCTVLGRPDLASDARFATNAERWENSAQLSAEITAVLATRDAVEWAALLRDAGIPGGVINSVSQALDDEQVQALGLLAGAPELPEAKYAFVHTPLLTGGQRFPIRSLAPELNAHAAELLAELGLDDLEPASADVNPARSGEGKDD